MISKSFDVPYSKVFEACKIAITKCGYKIETDNEHTGIVRASTSFTIFSWGEDVTIEVKKINGNTTNVTVESSPKAQLFDWGKSPENENRIIKYLGELLNR